MENCLQCKLEPGMPAADAAESAVPDEGAEVVANSEPHGLLQRHVGAQEQGISCWHLAVV